MVFLLLRLGTTGFRLGLFFYENAAMGIHLIEEARLPTGIASLEEFKQRYRDQIPQ